MNNLVNPNGYVPGYVKAPNIPYKIGKKYLAKLAGYGLPMLVGKEEFRTATEAEKAAKNWREKLVREYDLELLKAVESTLPHAVEEGERTVTGEA